MNYRTSLYIRGLFWIGVTAGLFGLCCTTSGAQRTPVRPLDDRAHAPRELGRINHNASNVMEAIEQDGNLKGFAELLQMTNLREYVRTAQVTVFAPQDPACGDLLRQARLWKQQNNGPKLDGLRISIKHHLLAGKYMWRPGAQKDVKQLQGDTLEMVSGFRLAIYPTSTAASFTLQVSNSRRARVLRADMVEPNGILFVIDRQLDAHSVKFD